jgi:hypothetical protein
MSRKRAIDNFCKACIFDRHSPGTWREQVQGCTAPNCSLYPYRPLPSTANAAHSAKTDRKSTQIGVPQR